MKFVLTLTLKQLEWLC